VLLIDCSFLIFVHELINVFIVSRNLVCVCVCVYVCVCVCARARVCACACVCVCHLEASTTKRPRPEHGCCDIGGGSIKREIRQEIRSLFLSGL
jgi:hypothetical protein